MSEWRSPVASQVVRDLLGRQGFTVTEVAQQLARGDNYVSDRLQGREAWTSGDLDAIAGLLGLADLELFIEITRRAQDHSGQSTPTRCRSHREGCSATRSASATPRQV